MQNVYQQQQPIHQHQPQQTIDYSRLVQNVPAQTSTTIGFSQLMQATPQPQPQVSLAPPIVPTIEPLSKSSNQASSSMTKTTKEKKKKTTATTVVGGASRQQAAENSEAELRRFDWNVSE
jgi:hypothetical protein